MNELQTILINRSPGEPVDVGIHLKLTATEKALVDALAKLRGESRNVLIRSLIVEAARDSQS